MKILLVQLYSGTECEFIYPIGLSYLATSSSKHDIKIFDQNLCVDDPFLETEKVISEFSPNVVGISIRNIHIYSKKKGFFNPERYLSMTIDSIKRVSDKIPIVAGGPGFSIFPRRIMQNEPRINFGIFLEGEKSFPHLLENLNSPEKVRGVFWRTNGDISFTDGYTHPDFETLPEPRRDLIDPLKYKGEYAIGIQSKRGCLLNCSYCAYLFLSGKTMRLRSPENVVDEIEHLVNNYGLQEFAFVDNVFNIPKIHAEKICQEIIRKNLRIRWTAWFNEKFMDEEFIDLVISAGCNFFEFSPDGYSNSSLRWLNKNIRTKDIINTFRLIRKKPNIKVRYNFMLGIPGQNIFSLARQAFFCIKLKLFLKERLKAITFNKLGIDPNTGLEKIALNEGVITPLTDLFKPTFYEVGIIRWIRKYKVFFLSVLNIFKKLH